MVDKLETVIKVTLVVLFLLYAYFMIGGYTPACNTYPIDNFTRDCAYGQHNYNHHHNYSDTYPLSHGSYSEYNLGEIPQSPTFNGDTSHRNIYQSGPYLNI